MQTMTGETHSTSSVEAKLSELEFSICDHLDTSMREQSKLLSDMKKSFDAAFFDQQARLIAVEESLGTREKTHQASTTKISDSIKKVDDMLADALQRRDDSHEKLDEMLDHMRQQQVQQEKLNEVFSYVLNLRQDEVSHDSAKEEKLVQQYHVATMTTPRLALSVGSQEASERSGRPEEPSDRRQFALEFEKSERMMAGVENLFRSASSEFLDALPSETPEPEGMAVTLLQFLSPCFLFVVVVNAGWIYFVVNWEVMNPLSQTPGFIYTVELCFMILYTFELLLRLFVHRLYFFWTYEVHWNLLDFFLVVYSLSEVAFESLSFNKLIYLRSLRILRMAKVLRVFRLVKFIKQLRIILNCLLGSVMHLLWSMVMMWIVFYMFSMVFVQGVASLLQRTESTSYGETTLLFGSVESCFLSLFKSVSGGDDWSRFYEALVPVGKIYTGLYLFFVAFTNIAFLNVLTGIFVENALMYAKPEHDRAPSMEFSADRSTIQFSSGISRSQSDNSMIDIEEDGNEGKDVIL